MTPKEQYSYNILSSWLRPTLLSPLESTVRSEALNAVNTGGRGMASPLTMICMALHSPS